MRSDTPDLIRRLLAASSPVAIAHRGGSALAPENTLAAFDQAVALGADAVECDVHLSRDREPVVIHDESLDRTTDARGPVSTLTAGALERVDAGYWFKSSGAFPFRGRGIGVPQLADVLRRHPVVPFVVEIKGDDARAAKRVVEVVAEVGAEDRVIFGGFSHAVLSAVRARPVHLVTSASKDEVRWALRRSYFWLPPRRTGFDLFQVPLRFGGRRILTKSMARTLRRAGIPVHVWVVDDVTEMRRLLSWGVTGLISDRPDLAVGVVKEARVREP